MAEYKVVGKIGSTILVDPDGQDKWLVNVTVDEVPPPAPAEGETPPVPPPAPEWNVTVGPVIKGAQFMVRQGGYVEDVTEADRAIIDQAQAALDKNPPVIPEDEDNPDA